MHAANKFTMKMNTEYSRQEDINNGVRQGCPLSPKLFDINMDDILKKWIAMNNGGVQISRTKRIATILLADDQLIIADSEDKL
jgi:hypothetical protein